MFEIEGTRAVTNMQRETWRGNERTDMFSFIGFAAFSFHIVCIVPFSTSQRKPLPKPYMLVSNRSTDVNINQGRSTCAGRKLSRNPKGIHQMTNSDRSFQAMMSGARRKWGGDRPVCERRRSSIRIQLQVCINTVFWLRRVKKFRWQSELLDYL